VLLAGARSQCLVEVWIDAQLHAWRAAAIAESGAPHADALGLGQVVAAIPLTSALQEGWQYAVLAAAAVALLLLRRGVVQTLLAAGAVGLFASVAGAPLSY